MNRGLKNVIMIALCLLLAGAMVFTWFLSSKRTGFDPQQMTGQSFGGRMGQRPEGFGDGEMPQMPQGGQMPQMPDGEMPQMPEGGENPRSWNMPNQSFDPGEMPQMPQGGQMGERPEMPEGFDGQMPEGFDGQMPGGMGRGRGVSVVYYVIFGAEALVFSLLLLYLLFSGFNGRTFRETFGSPLRVILYILFVLLLSAGLSFGFFFLTRRSRMARFAGFGGMGNPEYNSANEIRSSGDYAETSYISTAADENALSVSGVSSISLTNVEISKSGDSDGGDTTSFYGTNSAMIARDSAKVTLTDCTVTTDAVGANGVFCYGGSATTMGAASDGTEITISDCTITTNQGDALYVTNTNAVIRLQKLHPRLE